MAGDNLLVATGVAGKILFSAQLSTTTTTTLLTAAASTSVRLTAAVVCNTTGSSATVTLGICKTGDTAGASHNVVSAVPIPAGDSLELTAIFGNMILGPGDFISGGAGTTTAITFVLSGIVNT